MRKLKLQMQMTLDGFVGGINGEMDWMTLPWTQDLNDYITDYTENMDTIILGRKLAQGFIPYWSGVAADENNPENEAGKTFTNTKKVVFTKTLEKNEWDNTVLAKGDLVEEINNLKNQDGNQIMTYGGATFVSSLIKNDLIDEFLLLVNPVIIGNGLPIFKEISLDKHFKLIESKPFECGIVALHYKSNN